jgi:hypothetical protein
MPSLVEANNIFARIVQEFPDEIESMARELGAFSRSRAIRNSEELLRAVLLYCGLDYSLREVATNFTQAGYRLSDEAVRGRLLRCERWLEAMLQRMLPKPEGEFGARRLILVDGTCVQAPGPISSDYRLHLAWDWLRQRVSFMLVSDCRTAEKLDLYPWQPGDVALADAGYARRQDLIYVRKKGADYIVRHSASGAKLYTKDGLPLKLADELKKCDANAQVSIPVKVTCGEESHDAFLHAFRLSEKAAERARRKVKRRAQKQSRVTPRVETLYLAEWLVVLTSFDADEVPAEVIGKLYRARWEIELVIKRLKSILNLNALRARRGSQLAQVYLLGKSLYALMVEKRALRSTPHREVDWRLWRIVADQIRSWITLLDVLCIEITPRVLKVLKERKRKRRPVRKRLLGVVNTITKSNQLATRNLNA